MKILGKTQSLLLNLRSNKWLYTTLLVVIAMTLIPSLTSKGGICYYHGDNGDIVIHDIRVKGFRSKYKKYNHLYDYTFTSKLIKLSDSLLMKPNHIMAVLMHESSLDANAYNPYGDAMGLYQFTPITRKALGTTKSELDTMSALNQLDVVYQYLKPYRGKVNHYSDFAVIGSAPSYYGYPNWYVVYKKPMLEYRVNPTWDVNKDGLITIGELRTHYVKTSRKEVRYFFD